MSSAETPTTDAAATRRLALAWRIAPATVEFVLDTRTLSASGRDLIDSLLFAAIMSANVAPVTRDPTLQLAYAAIGDAAPVTVRRPVSVNAIAHSLRMPFETARRRVASMARIGTLEITPRGVQVPDAIVTDPHFIAAAIRRHQRLGLLHAVLLEAGAVSPPTTRPAASADPPVRITNRALWEYVLRVTDELILLVGDALSGLILFETVRQNTAGFSTAELAAWATATPPTGRPVRIAGLAQGLGLSVETTRRYVMGLEAAGFCARGTKGVVATAPPGLRPTLDKMVLDNLANVQRMFVRLDQLGALGAWQVAPDAGSPRGAAG